MSTITIEECKKLARSRGGICLTEKYKNNRIKMSWTCANKHFWRATYDHIKSGTWCGKCSKKEASSKLKYNAIDVVTIAQKQNIQVLTNNYKNNKQKLHCKCLLCNYPWFSTLDRIKSGHACPKCGKIKASAQTKHDISYIKEYLLSKNIILQSTKYINRKAALNVQCYICNYIWNPSFSNIMQGKGCPECFKPVSGPQYKIQSFINNLGFITENNTRKIIFPLELDIFIPVKMIAIEYCGLYWHGERSCGEKAKERHINKLILCEKKGISLLTIFEDEYMFKSNQVNGYLTYLLGKTINNHNAQECNVALVSNIEATEFHSSNNIHGSSDGMHIGLYFNGLIVSLATIVKGTQKNVAELTRFTNKIGFTTNDALIQLIKYFTNINKNITKIISYIDDKWGTPSDYVAAGFKFLRKTEQKCFYFKHGTFTRHDKTWLIENNILLDDNAICINYDCIWDCGSSQWLLSI